MVRMVHKLPLLLVVDLMDHVHSRGFSLMVFHINFGVLLCLFCFLQIVIFHCITDNFQDPTCSVCAKISRH